MTKEEYIKKLIDLRKQGHEQPRNAICNEVACSDCYFACEPCNGHDVINVLLDHIIDNEAEHQETNLEHYWKKLSIGFLSHNNEAYENYRKQCMALFDWLLAPYEEPPKPKYKLTQFEYDVLDSYDYLDKAIKFNNYYPLNAMKDKGYFKGIPDDVDIFDIVNNAEVIDE